MATFKPNPQYFIKQWFWNCHLKSLVWNLITNRKFWFCGFRLKWKILDWQSKSKIQFQFWVVNHNLIHQTGLQSGSNNRTIQSSNTLIITNDKSGQKYLTINLLIVGNFINIKHTNFLYERHFGSFFLVTCSKSCQNDIRTKNVYV